MQRPWANKDVPIATLHLEGTQLFSYVWKRLSSEDWLYLLSFLGFANHVPWHQTRFWWSCYGMRLRYLCESQRLTCTRLNWPAGQQSVIYWWCQQCGTISNRVWSHISLCSDKQPPRTWPKPLNIFDNITYSTCNECLNMIIYTCAGIEINARPENCLK